ncbi:MAG: IS1595 family transposase, partial [Peptostreptococcaceae bacterium]
RLFETDRESIKTKNFIVQSNVAYGYTKVKDFRIRIPQFM